MAVKFSNNARTNLSSAILSTATSITVDDASVFPTLGASDHTFVTFESLDASPTREIVKVTAIDTSTDTLTVVRGQDGTTAAAFSSGAKVELRLTAALLNAVADDADTESVSISGDTMTGALINTTTGSRFTGLSIGADADIYLYESATNEFSIRTGPSSGYNYFTFNDDGSLNVLSGGATFAGTISSGTITVSGEIYATNSSNNLIIGNSASGNIYLGGGNSNTSNIYLQTGSSVALTLDSSNNAIFAGKLTVGPTTGGSGSLFRGAGEFASDATALQGASDVPLVVQATDDNTTAFGMLNQYGYQNFALNISGASNSATDRGTTDFYNKDNGSWSLFLSASNSSVDFPGTATWSGGSSTNANTAYTYSQVGHVPLAGGTMTGSLNLGGYNVTGVDILSGNTFAPSGTTTTPPSLMRWFNLSHAVEGEHVSHPYFFNDLANFQARGGTVTVGGLNTTPSFTNVFKANPLFAGWLASNYTGSTMTITLTSLPHGLNYTGYIGISFGNTGWAPASCKIEVSTDGGSNWTTRLNDSSKNLMYFTTTGAGGTAVNAIRFTLGQPSSAIRLTNIWAYNYNSDGMEQYFISRGGDTMYGALDMGANSITSTGSITSGAITSTGSSTFTSTTSMDINLVANPPELNFEDTSSTSGTKRARWTLDGNTFSAHALNDADTAVTHQLLNFNLSSGAAAFGGTISSGTITSSGSYTVPNSSQNGLKSANGNNFLLPLDQYNNMHIRSATGSEYHDSSAYYFRKVDQTEIFRIDGNGVDVRSGSLRVSGTDVITSSRAVYGNDLYVDNVRVSVPYKGSKQLDGLAASGAQAKRYHIGRIYCTPGHWSTLWTSVKFRLVQYSYGQGDVTYLMWGDYTGNDSNGYYLNVQDIFGTHEHDVKMVLGSMVDTGWDYSGRNVYYQDIYVDVDYYLNYRLYIESTNAPIYNSNASSGDGFRFVIYDSPTSSNISGFTDLKKVTRTPNYRFTGTVDHAASVTFDQSIPINFGSTNWQIYANGNDLVLTSSDDINYYAGWQRFFYNYPSDNPDAGNVEYARIGSSNGNWLTGNLELKNSGNLTTAGTVTWSGGGSANANTAYTYSQVGHLPLAGGTVSGNVTVNGSLSRSGNTVLDSANFGTYLNGTYVNESEMSTITSHDDAGYSISGTYNWSYCEPTGQEFGRVHNQLLGRTATIYYKSGSTWTSQTTNSAICNGHFTWGQFGIPYGTAEVAFDFGNSLGYSFFKSFALSCSGNGHSFTCYVEKSYGSSMGGTWNVIGSVSGIGGWPGGGYVKCDSVVGSSYEPYFRIRVVPNWNSTYSSNSISIGGFNLIGSYGAAPFAYRPYISNGTGLETGGDFRARKFIKYGETNYHLDLKDSFGNVHLKTSDGGIYQDCQDGFFFRSETQSNWATLNGTAINAYRFRSFNADNTPNNTQFSNAFAALDNNRCVYFDGNGSSPSTWYGSQNTAYAAIDVSYNSMNFWVYVGGWSNMVDISTSGLVCSSNITAYGSTSDIRLKENIEVIPEAMDKIRKLDGITFNYKKDGSKSTGLIAQQLLEVLPEVVYETEDIDHEYGEEPSGEKHYAVRYGNVVGLLVEGLKEQDREIQELKLMVKTLMEKLDEH